jgi:hypothetical protein
MRSSGRHWVWTAALLGVAFVAFVAFVTAPCASAMPLLRGAEFDAESCAAAYSDWKAPRELLDRIRRAR